MKQWEIVWDMDGSAHRATVRARDVEHAIKVWKRDWPKVGVRAVTQVWKVSR